MLHLLLTVQLYKYIIFMSEFFVIIGSADKDIIQTHEPQNDSSLLGRDNRNSSRNRPLCTENVMLPTLPCGSSSGTEGKYAVYYNVPNISLNIFKFPRICKIIYMFSSLQFLFLVTYILLLFVSGYGLNRDLKLPETSNTVLIEPMSTLVSSPILCQPS